MFKINNCQANRRIQNRRQIVDQTPAQTPAPIVEVDETEVHIVSQEQLGNEMELAMEMVRASVQQDQERVQAIDAFLSFHTLQEL